MFSPMMTVLVLAVLWMIVVIPMVVKRNDDRAGEKSAAKFGTAMRALSTPRSLGALARPAPVDDYRDSEPQIPANRPQVFVPGGAPRVSPAARRPVPAAMEAVVYSDRIDKADMSEARRQMMARRRRSLTVLSVGVVLGLLLAVVVGGAFLWTLTLLFVAGLAGYLLFLRNQALHDRHRRESRVRRSGLGQVRGYDATEEFAHPLGAEAVVQIDDEDVALRGMADTVDLTGLYLDEHFDERPMRRAV